MASTVESAKGASPFGRDSLPWLSVDQDRCVQGSHLCCAGSGQDRRGNLLVCGATPTEAAAWVEYAYGPASSRQGAMRAANGNSNAFKVKYWEVGNEIWRDWVHGHSDANTY